MKKTLFTISFIFLIAFTLFAYDFPIKEKEDIQKTLKFSKTAKEKYLELENVNGSIKVVGYKGDEVKLNVHRTIEARSKQKADEAKEKEKLEISEQDNLILIYIDTPYRRKDGSINYKGPQYYGYKVTFDFEIKVPYETNIDLETINDGDIHVENVQGNFDVNNINGGVEMREVSGSGRAYALNENLEVVYSKNPESDCYFGSLNGDVKVTFLDGLSADFRLKTFNGEAYTDFEVTHVPDIATTKESKKGKYIYKSNKRTRVRVGKGGPELEFDAFNGDIKIIKK
jgi:DUF4097 and DUF4098 domain-containing protein YvlB